MMLANKIFTQINQNPIHDLELSLGWHHNAIYPDKVVGLGGSTEIIIRAHGSLKETSENFQGKPWRVLGEF